MKILLAIDGSSYSDAAVAEVCRRPWPAQTEIHIITVLPPIDASLLRGSPPTAYDELVKEQRAELVRHLNAAAAAFQQHAPGISVTPFLREGSPKEAILDEAERWGADLIVIGSHGYGAIKRFFLGSVSLAIATNASCSVEIVRTPIPAAIPVASA